VKTKGEDFVGNLLVWTLDQGKAEQPVLYIL